MQAMTTQVKLAEDKELASFACHLLCEIVQFCSQLSAEKAKVETGQRAMAPHEKRVIKEVIDDRKTQLGMVDVKANDRRNTLLKAEEGI